MEFFIKNLFFPQYWLLWPYFYKYGKLPNIHQALIDLFFKLYLVIYHFYLLPNFNILGNFCRCVTSFIICWFLSFSFSLFPWSWEVTLWIALYIIYLWIPMLQNMSLICVVRWKWVSSLELDCGEFSETRESSVPLGAFSVPYFDISFLGPACVCGRSWEWHSLQLCSAQHRQHTQLVI